MSSLCFAKYMGVASFALYLSTRAYKKVTKLRQEKEASSQLPLNVAQKGDAAFEEKKWDDAIDFYTVAIQLDGANSNATCYTKRAEAYIELGRFELAKEDCNTAIRIDQKNVKAYLLRGKAQEMLGRDIEAYRDISHARYLDARQQEQRTQQHSTPARQEWSTAAARPWAGRSSLPNDLSSYEKALEKLGREIDAYTDSIDAHCLVARQQEQRTRAARPRVGRSLHHEFFIPSIVIKDAVVYI